ncbi:MAG TPA: polysaccharide pyruvyl transferase family protein [Pseudonocardiaceae bacterium]|nr:polysaccharide pyruvyl transferase family protein [Pseudonocardiaceae bacterium]
MTLTSDRTRTLLYVGWTGQHNLGDDAIADALIPRLPAIEPAHAPYRLGDFLGRIAHGGLRGSAYRALLLGGGTAIGRRNWRLVLSATGATLARSRPWFLVGAGVEDPAFQGVNSFSGNGELTRWRDVLARFDAVTVRGPRSVRLLDSVGVPARMVGDPALLHEPAELPPAREKLLGINLGYGDDLWGHDHDRVVDAVAGLVRELAGGRDWRVRAIVVNPADEPSARACLTSAGIGPDRAEVVVTPTTERFFTAVGECTLLVAERLHALVLAVAAGVPVVGLEYQPKCADFLGSVGAAEHSVRTDQVSATDLVERVTALAEDRPAESARLLGEVTILRKSLVAEVERIRESVLVSA